MKRLSPDDLGEKGESRFRELCADEGLVCNRVERDRVGWDFIVDFGFSDVRSVSLDKRLAPRSCLIQVKTIFEKNRSVKVRLNMAERLAKDLKPAFILVFQVDDRKQITRAFLLHIIDERLASILARLRRESANGTNRDRINRKEISFTPEDFEQIEVSGTALREAMERLAGDDPTSYAAEKRKQIQRLGYEHAPYEVNVSLVATGQLELEEIFLGLRKEVTVLEISSFERRFDIRLPVLEPQPAKITIKPKPVDRCRLTFRATGLTPTTLEADVFFSPPQIALNGRTRTRIEGRPVVLDIYSGDNYFNMSLQVIPPENDATLEEWTTYFSISQTVHLKGKIELERSGEPTIDLPLDAYKSNFQPGYAHILMLCEQMQDLAKLAGISSRHRYVWNDIVRARQAIYFVHLLRSGKQTEFTLVTPIEDGAEEHPLQERFFVDEFFIGSMRVGYYVKANVSARIEGDSMHFMFSEVMIREARVLDQAFDDDAYLEKVIKLERTEGVGRLVLQVAPEE